MRSVLERYFSLQETGPEEYLCICPFHEDDKPSLSVNLNKKVFFCHACSEKGSIPKLLAKTIPYDQSLISLELDFLSRIKLPKFNLSSFKQKLTNNDKVMDYLIEKRLWTPKVIDDLQLGFDGNRILIPVFNIFGDLLNIRAYRPGAKKDEPKVINLKGFGQNRLFNLQQVRHDSKQVLICEGEPDCIAATSKGFTAISSTAGAGKFDSFWASAFKGRITNIVYDNDKAGVSGSQRVAAALAGAGAKARIIELDGHLQGGKDLTDYFLQGETRESLEALIEETSYVQAVSQVEDDPTIYEVSLSESSQEKYYKKKVKIKVMVSGKMLSPYIVPSDVRVYCSKPGLKMCNGCALDLTNGEKQLEFNGLSEEILQLIETQADNHIKVFKKVCGVPARCQIVKAEIKKAQNIEEAKVIPALDFSDDDSMYVLRQVYYLGHGLEPNTTYELTGLTIPHPKTQQVTYLISEASSLEDMVSKFEVTEEVIKRLRIFSLETNKEEVR